MKTGRNHCGGAFIDGKFYVVGGPTACSRFGCERVYDPQTNTWARQAPLPAPRGGIGVAAVNGELYVFGGETLFRMVAARSTVKSKSSARDQHLAEFVTHANPASWYLGVGDR